MTQATIWLTLKLYGFDNNSCAWIISFLNGRTQRVRIGKELSTPLDLTSGAPQGGILSPIMYTIFL